MNIPLKTGIFRSAPGYQNLRNKQMLILACMHVRLGKYQCRDNSRKIIIEQHES